MVHKAMNMRNTFASSGRWFVAMLALGLWEAQAADLSGQVVKAASRLAAASGYAWKTFTQTGQGGLRAGQFEGRATREGVVYLSSISVEPGAEAYLKDGKGVIRRLGVWETLKEAALSTNTQAGAMRWLGRMLQSYQAPAAEATELATRSTNLRRESEAITGILTEEAVRGIIGRWGVRVGDAEPQVSEPRGVVKFWVQDGVLTRYEYRVSAVLALDGNRKNVDRTTTVELEQIGSATVELPEEARAKLGL